MTKIVDLHTHSTASDGTDSPAALARQAKDIGLAALALTDHDTVAGVADAREEAASLGLEFVAGCEISTMTDQGEFHILGYWTPDNNPDLNSFLQSLRDGRMRRNEIMLEKLKGHGFNISMSEVRERARGSVGRPHMAEVMLAKGYVKDRKEAFDLWLGVSGKAYAPKRVPAPEVAVRVLREAGASPALAHPLLRPLSDAWLENFVSGLKKEGLFAIEAWHSAQTEEQGRRLERMAERLDLGVCGGSDYHGRNKPAIELGSGMGGLRLDYEILDKLKRRRLASGLPV